MMAGKWIDLFIIIAFAIAIWRGFRRGIIREIFSLFGVLLAVAIGFYRHEELSLHLMARFPLGQGAALLIAFLILVIGISLVAKFIGYLWGKVVKFTPFAVLDGILGATFGTIKVLAIVIALVLMLHSLNVESVEDMLAESSVVQQIDTLWPHLRLSLEQAWPETWAKPGWLFPQPNFDDLSFS
jgi:uncharacterized membrane protein required for colicin V production